ncbi:ribosome-inactivating family protein [Streptomyces kunmingensis]|uniref:Ribosome-inactivating family protein n=1 Tax=Streptomyces kunmingensis TaxID=68225 RepID=A0ABU6C4J1_9ACTN|nr:ribosome-inactivating family protein [Streptomyces kunmingensis]MEB3959639.1 ribosome-inactivating family protein [Streptomyces kunmingensis]
MTIDTSNGHRNNTSRYQDVITKLRQASGHIWNSGDVYATQTTSAGLIALRLLDNGDNAGREMVTVYFNPTNMYLGGFRAQDGQLYAFSDASENVRTEMARGGPVNLLPFAGTYGALRDEISSNNEAGEPAYANVDTMYRAAQALGETVSPTAAHSYYRSTIASSMMLLIGAFSEGSRFTGFRDVYSRVFDGENPDGSVNQRLTEVSNTGLQSLRADWSKMSRWMQDIVNGTNPGPLYVNNIGTFYTYADAHVHLRLILSKKP